MRRLTWIAGPMIWCAVGICLPAGLAAQDILISEFLASGDSGLKDSGGEASDWIELWNPSGANVDLEGWHLTDDSRDLRKWTFPPLSLGAGQYLVVFASGKDRSVAGAELHTNFKFDSGGEYLALVKADGISIAHAYSPAYPEQHDDISYGVGDGSTVSQLVSQGASARFLIPSGPADGIDWAQASFDDSGWAPAALGVGYEDAAAAPGAGGDVNLALNAAATQSSEYGGFPASLAVDGDLGNFTATSASDPSPSWDVDLGRSAPIRKIVVRNRGDGCCQSRLRDLQVSVLDAEGDMAFESTLLNAENVLGGGGTGGPTELSLDLVVLTGGPVQGRGVRISRTPDPDNSGTGGVGGPDEATVLSLGEVEVFGAVSAYSEWIRTDVKAAMQGVNTSAYVRAHFDVADPASLDRLVLRMRYDDGFVAYLNGVEVARRNAPEPADSPPAWNAQAAAERASGAGAVPEEIDLSAHRGVLAVGRNVLALQGLSSGTGDPNFLIAPELEARSGSGRALRYFSKPTPGAPNDPNGVMDFVADTKFSVGRGFFESPIDVEISTATPGAQIRYTLDLSNPTASTGLAHEGPIHVTGTTVIRAAAFKAGYAPTNVDTQTYLFLDDVLKQPAMLKDIVASPTYGPELVPSLLAVPTVSLVTRSALNGSTEVPVSVELMHPDGSQGFQIDAGIKKVGGHSLVSYPKNNMRLYFRKQYGQAKLKYPLYKGRPYGDLAVEAFDRLNLRSGSHDSVFYLGDDQQSPANAQYIRNRWMNDLQFQMGQPSINGLFVQVYLNGAYWGFYDLMEWPSQEYLSSYFGGSDADYCATNSGRPVGDSNIAAWNKLVGLAGNYPELKRYLDVVNMADYLVLNFYGGNAWDWNPNQNWMAGGPVAPDRGGFKLFCWDSDIVLRRTNDFNLDRPGPSNLFQLLKANPEFRVLLGDRAHRHLFNGGALTPERAKESYSSRAEEIRSSLVAETARWRWGGKIWTRDNQWQKELTRILTDFIPRRAGILLDQLRTANLYPRLAAPSFSQQGGLVPRGYALTISAPEGTVYYTLDGSDPRLPGGALNPSAMAVGVGGVSSTIVPSGSSVKVLVPTDGDAGLDWTRPDFDDSSWRLGKTGVGFEEATGFEGEIGTDIAAEAFEKSATVYLRVEFDIADPTDWTLLKLRMKYDDGFVAYLNGTRIASANAPATPDWSSTATASHADNQALVFQDFDVSGFLHALQRGQNVLAIHGLNLSAASNDFLVLPELAGSNGKGGAISIDGPLTVKARTESGAQWSALNESFFWLDIPLRITEIHYHPRPWNLPEVFDADEFELIELSNLGTETISLEGFKLSGGISFDFSQGVVTSVQPGEVVLLVENAVAFAERYGAQGLKIAGEYSGRLGNSGDRLRLLGPRSEPILDFAFSDAWYPRTDGEGYSLILASVDALPGAWGDAATWTESPRLDGSPGFVEALHGSPGGQVPSDATQDGKIDISDAVALLGHLFLGRPSALPCGDGTVLDPGNRELLDATGDGSIDLTDAIRVLSYLFLSGAPPVLGTSCVPADRCPGVCAP